MHGILAIKTDQIICLFVRCKRKKSMAKTLKFVCVVVILFLFLILVAAEMDGKLYIYVPLMQKHINSYTYIYFSHFISQNLDGRVQKTNIVQCANLLNLWRALIINVLVGNNYSYLVMMFMCILM